MSNAVNCAYLVYTVCTARSIRFINLTGGKMFHSTVKMTSGARVFCKIKLHYHSIWLCILTASAIFCVKVALFDLNNYGVCSGKGTWGTLKLLQTQYFLRLHWYGKIFDFTIYLPTYFWYKYIYNIETHLLFPTIFSDASFILRHVWRMYHM